MRKRSADIRPRKTGRRWHIPPPLLHGPEALEGGDVLHELPGELGVVLWQAFRDVMLTVATPPAVRTDLFAPEAERRRLAALICTGGDPQLEAPLRTLAKMVGDPGRVPVESVAIGCRQISQWAEARGALATALAFAQDAALACPGDPTAALNVGRIAYKVADHARAEIWFRRAIGIARQGRDWTSYTHAFLGLGNLYVRRGNYPSGRRYRVRALRGARRGGLRQLQGMALHDLFILEAECGRFAEAESFARKAFESYGSKSARLPALANDLAYLWIENGYFSRALKLLRPLARLSRAPQERLFVLASTARSAGGTGDRATFDEVVEEARACAADPAAQNGAARVFLDLAYGAASLQDWKAAEEHAEMALQIASLRSEAKVVFTAESVLESVRRRQALTVAVAVSREEVGEFAEEFAECLNATAVAAV